MSNLVRVMLRNKEMHLIYLVISLYGSEEIQNIVIWIHMIHNIKHSWLNVVTLCNLPCNLPHNGSICYVERYMKGGVTLGNVLCDLSCNVDRKGLGHIVKFRANTNLELPKKEFVRVVADGGVTLCNAENSTFWNDCSKLHVNMP